MSNDDKDQKPPFNERSEVQLGFDSDSFGEKERDLEPVFEDFDTEESFEAAYEASGESTFENSRYSSEYEDDTLDYDVDPESLMAEEEEFEAGAAATIAAAWQAEQLKPELVRPTEPEFDDEGEEEEDYEPEYEPEPAPAAQATGQKWENEGPAPWPMGLIAVGVVALLLLLAGGYGVMQQRAGMQEEIRSLQAAAATSVNPREVAASREAQRVLADRNRELLNTVDALHMEIRSLRDTTKGLESQLLELRSGKGSLSQKPKARPVAAAAKPTAPAPKKTATARPSSTAIEAGSWFVNFSSYGASETANSWVARLRPAHGDVVATPAVKNGKTFYRVRVVNLSTQTQAKAVAQALEQQYKLPKLWVGQQ